MTIEWSVLAAFRLVAPRAAGEASRSDLAALSVVSMCSRLFG